MDDEQRAAAHALADLLIVTAPLRAFKTLWYARAFTEQSRAVRVMAARVALLAPDGIHHRQYRTDEPGLDALLCAVVEAVRHRVPERGRIAQEALRHLGDQSHTAPRRLREIILDATAR